MLRGSAVLSWAVGSWLAATASAQDPAPPTELADLQAQLQQALDQQAQLNSQQEALTNALTPLLSWANHMAPHNTGCDLDHYTSVLTLCGADASAAEMPVDPDVDLVMTTDASCDCMESWSYKGQRYAGCQVTDQPPEMRFYHAPWCVVSSGCAGAHPGPWGAWDYCRETANWTKSVHGIEDAEHRQWFDQHGFNGQAPLDPWVMEPQALFTSHHVEIETPVTTYCGDEACQTALTRLATRCEGTQDTVMQEVVAMLSTASSSCHNNTISPSAPPPPGWRTYEVTVMMHSGSEMDETSVRDVVVTMLGCQEGDISDFQRRSDLESVYSFKLVTLTLNQQTINSLLTPVGDVSVLVLHGYDMTTEGLGDGGPSYHSPGSSGGGNAANPADADFNSLFLMFGFSTIGTLAAFAFCGTIGKVRKLSAPQEFELYGQPLLKHQRFEQPLTPGHHPDDDEEDPLAWLPAFEAGGQEAYGSWEAAEDQAWDSADSPYTESDGDDASYVHDLLGVYTPPPQDDGMHSAAASDAFSSQDLMRCGNDLGAIAQFNSLTDSDSESARTDVTPQGVTTKSEPVKAEPVEALYALPTDPPVARVEMLERQLAQAQDQLQAFRHHAVRPAFGLSWAQQQQQQQQQQRFRRPAADPWMQATLPPFLEMDGTTANAFNAVMPTLVDFPPHPTQPPSLRVSHPAASEVEDSKQTHPYRCNFPGCNYTAAQRRYLGEHARVHSGARPYRCPWKGCNYASSGSGHMSRHVRIHTGERPFKCTEPGCGYETSQSGHLRTHMRTHTGERPYNCPVDGCDYAASRAGHITRHMKVHDQGGRRRRGRPKKNATSSPSAAADTAQTPPQQVNTSPAAKAL